MLFLYSRMRTMRTKGREEAKNGLSVMPVCLQEHTWSNRSTDQIGAHTWDMLWVKAPEHSKMTRVAYRGMQTTQKNKINSEGCENGGSRKNSHLISLLLPPWATKQVLGLHPLTMPGWVAVVKPLQTVASASCWGLGPLCWTLLAGRWLQKYQNDQLWEGLAPEFSVQLVSTSPVKHGHELSQWETIGLRWTLTQG